MEQGTWLAEWYSNHDSRSGLTTLKTVLEKLFSIKGIACQDSQEKKKKKDPSPDFFFFELCSSSNL